MMIVSFDGYILMEGDGRKGKMAGGHFGKMMEVVRRKGYENIIQTLSKIK